MNNGPLENRAHTSHLHEAFARQIRNLSTTHKQRHALSHLRNAPIQAMPKPRRARYNILATTCTIIDFLVMMIIQTDVMITTHLNNTAMLTLLFVLWHTELLPASESRGFFGDILSTIESIFTSNSIQQNRKHLKQRFLEVTNQCQIEYKIEHHHHHHNHHCH